MAKLEREVFYAAYAVRKLLDAFKISDEIEGLSLTGLEYERQNRMIDLGNRDRIDELFDLSCSTECKVALREFCNQVIHSFTFVPARQDETNGLAGFFLASDRQKDKSLLYVDIDEVIAALLKVANDDIVRMQWIRDGVGLPMRIIKKSNQH